MTFLEMVKRLSVESGIGSGPSTVLGQTGEYLRVVNWIQSAYEEIQGIHPDWKFLWASTTFSALTQPVLTDFGSWINNNFRCYSTALGVSDEQLLSYVDWDTFRDSYYLGASRSQTGRPSIITIKPDTDILVWPTADDAYTVYGEYYKEPQLLVANTDEPLFPLHHMAVVWKGLEYYGAYSSEPDKYSMGASQFKRLLRKIELSQLPKISWGPPLA